MKKFLFALHLLFLVGIYTLWFNDFVAPSVFPYFQFVALAFPIAIAAHVILWLFWWLISWRYAGVLFIFSLGLYFPLQSWVNFTETSSPKEETLKVITYNVHYLRENKQGIYDFLTQENPDIFMAQETHPQNFKSFAEQHQYYYEHFPYITVLSKFPIVEAKELLDRTTNGHACYVDVKRKQDTLRFVNIYLEPMYLDKEMVKEMSQEETFEQSSEKVKNKLIQGYLKHQKQIASIKPYIQNSPYPVILGGDFNAVPYSYEYFSLSENMVDAFVASGNGLGSTFHDYKYPLRIDYLFTDGFLTPNSYEIPRIEFSDHYPVVGTFEWPSE